ncbi:MAG: choice-of-anchor D domain-containing protein [Verrucomicrobiaceae bacterium]
MYLKIISTALIASASSLLGQSMVTIHSEDFETGGGNLNGGNNHMTFTVTTGDPTSSGKGNVGSGDVGGGDSQWAAVNSVPNRIPLPTSAEPGTSTFRVSMMVYIPTATTFANVDRMGLILRWNGVQAGSANQYLEYTTFTPDTWQLFEFTGLVPATDGDGQAVADVLPIISFNDRDNDAAAGVAAYIDDYKIEISVSEDDPNLPLGSELGFGDIEQNGGPNTKVILLSNSGSAQNLTITGATLSGVNSDLFTLQELTYPLTLAPGETQELQVTVDPGESLGFLSAALEIASNDASSPALTTGLTANSVEPFVGREFIVNGDFETGDFTGWRNNARFDPTTDQARSGTNAAVFNLSAGQQWGEARIEHLDSDPIDSIPITPDMYGKDYFYSAWYLLPATNRMAADDTIQTIFRWNGINGPSNHTAGPKTVGSFPADVWTRVTMAGVIPETDLNGDPVTQVTILWSFRDVNSDSIGGELTYLDDISLKIDAPIVEPSGPLAITDIIHDAGNDVVTITYTTTPGVSYLIERSTGLNVIGEPDGWVELSDSELADEDSESFLDFGAPSASPNYFYRVRVAP